MDTLGRHLIADYWGCNPEVLTNAEGLRDIMERAALAAKATILQVTCHSLPGGEVSVTIIISESHLSIHAYPARRFAATDFYTCGDLDPVEAHKVVREALGAEAADLSAMLRGSGGPIQPKFFRWERGTVEQPGEGDLWEPSGTPSR